jgi:hypothetical protein
MTGYIDSRRLRGRAVPARRRWQKRIDSTRERPGIDANLTDWCERIDVQGDNLVDPLYRH